MLRGTILRYLLAFAIVRIAIATGDLIFAPREERFRIIPTDAVAARFWCRRLTAFVSWFVLGWLIIQQCRTLGFSFEGLQLTAYTLGLGLIAIALEAVWRGRITPREVAAVPSSRPHHFGRGARDTALSIGIGLLWIIEPGIDRVSPSFWLILVGITLPLAIFSSRRAIEQLLRPPAPSEAVERPPSIVTISLERGVRALWIIGAAGVLAWTWGVDLIGLAGEDTLFARFVHGVLSAVIILLVTDVVWHAMRVAIDAKLAASADPGQPNTDEARRRARLRTLLPIFRNVLFIVVVAVAVMMALAAIGVQIGPLIAGAGVVGVAIGFGAQTFARDVIAGIFYLMDDAFRVGEYIQSGNYKGTVEGSTFVR